MRGRSPALCSTAERLLPSAAGQLAYKNVQVRVQLHQDAASVLSLLLTLRHPPRLFSEAKDALSLQLASVLLNMLNM